MWRPLRLAGARSPRKAKCRALSKRWKCQCWATRNAVALSTLHPWSAITWCAQATRRREGRTLARYVITIIIVISAIGHPLLHFGLPHRLPVASNRSSSVVVRWLLCRWFEFFPISKATAVVGQLRYSRIEGGIVLSFSVSHIEYNRHPDGMIQSCNCATEKNGFCFGMGFVNWAWSIVLLGEIESLFFLWFSL